MPVSKPSIYPACECSICLSSTSVSCHLLFSVGDVPCAHSLNSIWLDWILPGTGCRTLRNVLVLLAWKFQHIKPDRPAEPNLETKCSRANRRCSAHKYKAGHRPVRYSFHRHNYSKIFGSVHWPFSFARVSFELTNCFSSQLCGCSLCK